MSNFTFLEVLKQQDREQHGTPILETSIENYFIADTSNAIIIGDVAEFLTIYKQKPAEIDLEQNYMQKLNLGTLGLEVAQEKFSSLVASYIEVIESINDSNKMDLKQKALEYSILITTAIKANSSAIEQLAIPEITEKNGLIIRTIFKDSLETLIKANSLQQEVLVKLVESINESLQNEILIDNSKEIQIIKKELEFFDNIFKNIQDKNFKALPLYLSEMNLFSVLNITRTNEYLSTLKTLYEIYPKAEATILDKEEIVLAKDKLDLAVYKEYRELLAKWDSDPKENPTANLIVSQDLLDELFESDKIGNLMHNKYTGTKLPSEIPTDIDETIQDTWYELEARSLIAAQNNLAYPYQKGTNSKDSPEVSRIKIDNVKAKYLVMDQEGIDKEDSSIEESNTNNGTTFEKPSTSNAYTSLVEERESVFRYKELAEIGFQPEILYSVSNDGTLSKRYMTNRKTHFVSRLKNFWLQKTFFGNGYEAYADAREHFFGTIDQETGQSTYEDPSWNYGLDNGEAYLNILINAVSDANAIGASTLATHPTFSRTLISHAFTAGYQFTDVQAQGKKPTEGKTYFPEQSTWVIDAPFFNTSGSSAYIVKHTLGNYSDQPTLQFFDGNTRTLIMEFQEKMIEIDNIQTTMAFDNTSTNNGERTILKTYNDQSSIQFLLNSKPDFFSNMFDIMIMWIPTDSSDLQDNFLLTSAAGGSSTSGGNIITPEIIALRSGSISVPQSKVEQYSNRLLGKTISKPKSKVTNPWKTSVKIDLDQQLFLLDACQRVSNIFVADNDISIANTNISTSVNKNLLTLFPAISKITNKGKINIYVSLYNSRHDLETNKIQNQTPTSPYLLSAKDLPYFIFEDVRFLGTEGDLQFQNDSANNLSINVPFIYRRSYKVDKLDYVTESS